MKNLLWGKIDSRLKEVFLMCHLDTDYRFAKLSSCCPDAISKLEKSLKSENGKEVVLIAYEKK